jgi:asparagine synthase (glutamine-hydrolysing)
MLFNGEAIFGAVDLDDTPGACVSVAQEISGAARMRGRYVCYRTAGRGTLGQIRGSAAVPPIATRAGLLAVSMGEFYVRGESEELFRDEPQRSMTIAERFASEGELFLQKIDGVFAFAIWNEHAQQLLLACDSRGDGRLFYALEGGRLSFSTWLPLLALPARAVDPAAVSEFLRFLYIAAPRTIYRGIKRLDGGCVFKFARGQVEVKSLHGAQPCSESAPAYSPAEFRTRFETSIRRRVGSRRAGVLLSGGVDSAALAAGCERVHPRSVEAFTVGFDKPELDETRAARALANQIGIPHRELRFAIPEYAAVFEQVIQGMEQPFGDPVELPLALACQTAKDSVEVICDGTGSDGMFGARIPRHLKFSLGFAARLPAGLRRHVGAALRGAGIGVITRQAPLFDFDDPEELFVTWAGWSRRELADLLGRSPDFHDSGLYRAYHAHAERGAQEVYDAIGVFPPDDSRFDCAALAGAPIALPYHDIELWRYVRALPEEWRFAREENKPALRRLLAEYAPGADLNKKRYFTMPLQELMAHSHYALINECLAPEVIKKHDAVDAGRVRPWIARYLAGDPRLRFKIWALIVLHAWLEAHRPAST